LIRISAAESLNYLSESNKKIENDNIEVEYSLFSDRWYLTTNYW